jgi:hypothetical protein
VPRCGWREHAYGDTHLCLAEALSDAVGADTCQEEQQRRSRVPGDFWAIVVDRRPARRGYDREVLDARKGDHSNPFGGNPASYLNRSSIFNCSSAGAYPFAMSTFSILALITGSQIDSGVAYP